MALTLAEANRAVEGAVAAATEMGIKINVAVVDAGGRLLAFNRMDGAIWGGAYGSQGKAVAIVGVTGVWIPAFAGKTVGGCGNYDLGWRLRRRDGRSRFRPLRLLLWV